MHNDPTSDELAKKAASLNKDTYEAGFRAGYQAAVAKVMQAAQSVSDFGTSGVLAGYQQTMRAAASPIERPSEIPKTASGRAAPGSIKTLVKEFVLTAGKPVKEADFAARYPSVIRPSRYMAFRGLAEEGVIIKRDGFWVPASSDAGSPSSYQTRAVFHRREGGTGHDPA